MNLKEKLVRRARKTERDREYSHHMFEWPWLSIWWQLIGWPQGNWRVSKCQTNTPPWDWAACYSRAKSQRNKVIPLLIYGSEMAIQVSNSEGSGRKGQNDFHIAFVLSLWIPLAISELMNLFHASSYPGRRNQGRTGCCPEVKAEEVVDRYLSCPVYEAWKKALFPISPLTYKLSGLSHIQCFPAFIPVSPLLKKKYLLRTNRMSYTMMGAFQMSFSPSKYLGR